MLTRRALPLPLTAVLLAAAATAGCAEGPAQAAPVKDAGVSPSAARSPARIPSPLRVADACSLVDVSDVSLLVALAEWQVAPSEQVGRSVCRLDTDGFTVVTVALPLDDPTTPPEGLCAPEGTRPAADPPGDVLCAYDGPDDDTATTVVAAAGTAIGVRVSGPDSARSSLQLARHALGHL